MYVPPGLVLKIAHNLDLLSHDVHMATYSLSVSLITITTVNAWGPQNSSAFTRYTVRAKRGGSQSSYDSGGNRPQSAGAMLRRAGEEKLKEEVKERSSSSSTSSSMTAPTALSCLGSRTFNERRGY